MRFERIIQEFKTEVEKTAGLNLKRVILFGSFARGDAVEGSDIDLLLVFGRKPSKDVMRRIRDISNFLSLKYDVVISEFLFTEKEFGRCRTPFLLNIKKEGVAV